MKQRSLLPLLLSPTFQMYCNLFNVKLKTCQGCEGNQSTNTILLQYCSNKFWLYGLQPTAPYNVANLGAQHSLHLTEPYVNVQTFTRSITPNDYEQVLFFLGGRRGTCTPKHSVNVTGESKNFKMLEFPLNQLQTYYM
jgi:hypothetical protein